jgi:hypothetical protein
MSLSYFFHGQAPWQRLCDPITAGVGALVGGLASAGGSIASGVMNSDAASSAAQLQYQSAQQALAFQKQVYGTEQQQVAPYIASGQSNLNQLNSQMGNLTAPFNPSANGVAPQFSYTAQDFQTNPGFQFALQQGQQALQRSAASKAGVLSGAAQKELANYTTGAAEQGFGTAYQQALQAYQTNYGNAFNTYEANQQNAYSRLAQQAGQGLSATGQANQAGMNYANMSGQYAVGAGNAAAAGTLGSANALASGLTGSTSAVGSATNNYLAQQNTQALLAALSSQSGYGGGGAIQNPGANSPYVGADMQQMGPSPSTDVDDSQPWW